MIYVDDIPMYAKNKNTLYEMTRLIEFLFALENFGLIKKLFVIDFNKTEESIHISCQNYIEQGFKDSFM